MTAAGPARAYYEACRGRWRAPVSIVVTDAGALRRSGMSLWSRLGVRLLAAWPAWLGRIQLDTTVSPDEGSEVVHTTVLRWLGLPLQKTVEIFTLDADGHRFTVRGSMSGAGSVDPSATRADYTLSWLGVQIRQQAAREGDRVTVRQEGPGFLARQELLRRAPTG
jgi:hypothetical protein